MMALRGWSGEAFVVGERKVSIQMGMYISY